MSDYKPLLDLILEHAEYDQGKLSHVGLKAVNPDFTTRGGFRWAFPGFWTRDPDATGDYTNDVCPVKPGDGLSVAKTAYGLALGGYPLTNPLLVVGFNTVLAEDTDKWKVAEAKTLAVVDVIRILHSHGSGAYLFGAYLSGAYLSGAYLFGADLSRADLSRANLSEADLSRAYGRSDWDALVERGAIR